MHIFTYAFSLLPGEATSNRMPVASNGNSNSSKLPRYVGRRRSRFSLYSLALDVTQAGAKTRLLGQLQAKHPQDTTTHTHTEHTHTQREHHVQPQASRHAAVHNKSNSYIIIISKVVGSISFSFVCNIMQGMQMKTFLYG